MCSWVLRKVGDPRSRRNEWKRLERKEKKRLGEILVYSLSPGVFDLHLRKILDS